MGPLGGRVERTAYVGIDVAFARGKRLPVSVCVREPDGPLEILSLRTSFEKPPAGRGNVAALREPAREEFAQQVLDWLRQVEQVERLIIRRIAIDAPSDYCRDISGRRSAERCLTGRGISSFATPSQAEFRKPLSLCGLATAGECYHEHRARLMVARQEGLTETYNRFHNPQEGAEDIRRLRELHLETDHAVAAAYGWTDLDLGHDFHETKQGVRYSLCETARREVLGRLLKLNQERYAEEVAQGLHEKGKPKSNGTQGGKRGQNGADAGLTSGRRDLFDAQLSLGEALE